MSRPRTARDTGSITALMVCVVGIFVACAGLVLDGGRFVAARTRSAAIAEEAARDGAQELRGLRKGRLEIDVERAVARSRRYLDRIGATGTVLASPRSVTVTVTVEVHPVLLGVVGLGSRTVSISRTAEPVDR